MHIYSIYVYMCVCGLLENLYTDLQSGSFHYYQQEVKALFPHLHLCLLQTVFLMKASLTDERNLKVLEYAFR